MPYQREIQFARKVAVAAGVHALQRQETGIPLARTKDDLSPVTLVDEENERYISDAIEREFPEDGIVAEEGARKVGTRERVWMIDPLDGTRDFVRGGRFWSVLIALDDSLGVAHFPCLGETYWAVRGRGAYLNQQALRVSNVRSVECCAFALNGLHHPEARPYLPRVMELAQRTWYVRAFGGAFDGAFLPQAKSIFGSTPRQPRGISHR